MSAAITLQNLTLGYDRHPAVHHIHGTFAEGSLTAIVGPNGAGKSTLLKGLMRDLKPLAGDIRFAAKLKHQIAYLPQAADIDRAFPISVYDLIAMGLWRRCGLLGRVSKADHLKVEDAIAAVGLTGFEQRPIGTLSGGQAQRMLFARLMVQDAAIILLDEPFTAVDARTQADLVALVARWHHEGRTIIAVLHDLELVSRSFPQTLMLARDMIGWGPTRDVLTAANLERARHMTEAFDDSAHVCEGDAA